MAAPKKKAEKTVPGNSLRVMDMSGVDKFCVATGKRLPKNGMVWAVGDDWFVSRGVARVYLKAQESANADT